MQTIIGSGGAIGTPLAQALTAYTKDIRLVSRNPKKVNDTDQLYPCDLTNFANLDAAIAGSEVVYVTIGFTYSLKVWQSTWPPFMRAVIDACKKHGAKLVFFDNIYSYATESLQHMTEESPLKPESKKGAVRKQLVDMIMGEVAAGKLQALIIRSADFYGPGIANSMLIETIVKPTLSGKTANAIGAMDAIHNYTYTPDAGNAAALLGNTADAYNQVWHAPTTNEKLTLRDWIQLIATEAGAKPKIRPVPAWMIRVMGIFDPVMREFPEMLYQFNRDYYFDSTKFEKRFNIQATKPVEGVREMINVMRNRE